MGKKPKRQKNPKGNGHTKEAALGTLLIIALSVGILLAANYVLPFKGLESRGEFHELMRMQFQISTIISSAMLLVSVYLVFIYLQDYLELRSGFTLGILLAIISFMLFAITSNPILHALFGIFNNPGIFSLIPMIFATISLGILAWVSSR